MQYSHNNISHTRSRYFSLNIVVQNTYNFYHILTLQKFKQLKK
jgi:hypothetical protein